MGQDKAVVAAVRTTPETVIEDYARVMELAGFKQALNPKAQTILKREVLERDASLGSALAEVLLC